MARPTVLATARLPTKLAERINLLRDNEEARVELQEKVTQHMKGQRDSKDSQLPDVTPRQLLALQLADLDAKMRYAFSSRPVQLEIHVKKLRKKAKAKKEESSAAAAAASKAAAEAEAAAAAATPHSEAATALLSSGRPSPGRYPPLPQNEWAAGVIETARGHNGRDPLELGAGGALLRSRKKGMELGGAFRCGVESSSSRHAAAAADGPSRDADGLGGAGGAGSGSGGNGLPPAATWLGPNFNTSPRTQPPTLADTMALNMHRTRFVDAAKREQMSLRQRDRNAEVSPRTPRLSTGPTVRIQDGGTSPRTRAGVSPRSQQISDILREARREQAPFAVSGHEVDHVEMATARMLLSTSLGIYSEPRSGAGAARTPISTIASRRWA